MDRVELVLIPCGKGHSYEWHDRTGHVVCSGWCAGNEEEASYAATVHVTTGEPATPVPTIEEVVRFATEDESLAVMEMVKRTERKAGECRTALQDATDAMRRLAGITNPASLPYTVGELP